MKKVIRLTENDLHRIVKNSVRRIMKEGKTVNNKPYFKKATQYVRGGYPDYGGGYEQDLGYYDTSKPGSKYAKDDIGKYTAKTFDAFNALNKQGYVSDDDYRNADDDYDTNVAIHNARQARKDDMDTYNTDKTLRREFQLVALKGGVPQEVLRKLSDETIIALYNDLRK